MCFPLALCRDPSKEHELFTRDDQELEPDHRDRQGIGQSHALMCYRHECWLRSVHHHGVEQYHPIYPCSFLLRFRL